MKRCGSENLPEVQQTDSYRQSLQELYDLLNQYYWLASGIEAKDAINDVAQAVQDILTALGQAELDADTQQYKRLKVTVNAVNAKLTTVRSQINDWIHVISAATEVSHAIDKALDCAAKVFPV